MTRGLLILEIITYKIRMGAYGDLSNQCKLDLNNL